MLQPVRVAPRQGAVVRLRVVVGKAFGMSYKGVIRRGIERLSGTRIYRTLPRGVDLFHDIRTQLPQLKVEVVFDVGANVGQSASSYVRHFDKPRIYCFEPVDTTYQKLERELRGRDNIKTFNLAFGAQRGQGTMVMEGASEMFFLDKTETSPSKDVRHENVTIETVDNFCRDQGIERINYLKVDTEGNDLEVLFGAEEMLRRQEIDLVEVESGMNSRNERHVAFNHFHKYLEEKSYFLFGIYEQVNEWLTGAPNLRRSNPVFISDRLIAAHTAS